ncbi:MAG: hypothetical protein HXY27_00635 [Hydrogenophilaceae bacterium]|nr:hypothetical protein [Hydrogenophilaceae bacterium]
MLLLAFGAALVPLDGSGQIAFTQLAEPVTYLSTLPGHIYRLIKTAILWAPVGFLYTLAGGIRVVTICAPLVVLGLLATGLVVLPDLNYKEVLEAVFAIPGLALGRWLAVRTKGALPVPTSDQNVASGTSAHVPLQSRLAPERMAICVNPAAFAGRGLAGRIFALFLVAGAGISLYQFPFMQAGLVAGLILYAALLWFLPLTWLIVIPPALALLDLAHWSGRFFWDEFDLLMLVTLAVALLQRRFKMSAWAVPKLGGLLGIFVLAALVSLLLGLFPLQPLDDNAFSAYWSHYNSLRVGKGLLWGLVFYGLYRSLPGAANAFQKFSFGMALGVLGVSLWVVWEQMMFAGTATTADYRVTAGFSSMHTGGGHIEAYLVIALPFVLGLAFSSIKPVLRILAGMVFLLGVYALFFTVSRGGAIALAAMLLIFVAGAFLGKRRTNRVKTGLALPLMLGAMTVGIMLAGVSGLFWKQRMEQTVTDAGIRFRHWAEVLDMRNAGVLTAVFGQGLGTLPASNLASQLPDRVGSYRYVTKDGNTWLALNSADTLYMAQRVAPRPNELLRLEIAVRAPATMAGLEASLCEKILFNSRQCQWLKIDFSPGRQVWHQHAQTFSSGIVGAGNWLTRRPVQFSLYNPAAGTVVEIDNVRLLDSRGRDLLKNGDFSKGGDFWFFKSNDHLFWHAKNLWVHLLFEQGWLGMMLFGLIMVLALVRLMRAVGQGSIDATVLLAVMSAWFVVGVVDSLVDAPRLALMVHGLLLVSAAWDCSTDAKPGRKRHLRRRHLHETRHHTADAA